MNGQEDENFEKLLQKNIKVSEENNKLLKKINSRMMWGNTMRLFYWLFIIGSVIGVYYFIQPFINIFQDNSQSIFSGFETLENVKSLLE